MNFFDRIRTAWANLNPLWRFLLVILVAGGGFLLVFGPAKSVYHQWKSANNLQQAKDALAENRFSEARRLSIQVLRLDAKAYEPLPILLRSSTALKDPLGARIATYILQDERASAEDHLLAWTHLCQSGPSYLPLNIGRNLAEEKKYSLDYLLPIIDRLLNDRMLPAVASIIASSPEPYPIELHCRLLAMLAKTASPEAYSEFHRSLAGQLRTKPEAWPLLLEVIDEIPQTELRRDIYEALPPSAISATSLAPASALRIIRCEMAANPEKSEELIESAFKRYQSSNPAAFVRWCLQIEQAASAANCMDLEKPAADPDLFRLQIQVLEATEQSDKLASFLTSAPLDIPAWESLAHLAAMARANDDQDLAEQSITDALKSATESPDPADLIKLARAAQDRQLDELALDAWTQAIIRGTGPLPPSESITFVIKQLSDQGRENELYLVLNSLHFIEIGNQQINAHHLYLACLSGRAEASAVIDKLTPLHEQHPDQLSLRCILAIAHVLCGEFQKADDLTNVPQIDWFGTYPAYRAIRGIVLAKTNHIGEARVYFEDFPWDDLLPSEERVYESLVDEIL